MDVNGIVSIVEQKIAAAEQEIEKLVAEGEAEAVKVEQAVVARLRQLLAEIAGAL